MARRKSSTKKGYCAERCFEVDESNLCDLYNGKRRKIKPSCRNCVHFNRELIIPKKIPKNPKSISNDDI